MEEFLAKIKALFLNIYIKVLYKDSNPQTPRFAALASEEEPSDLNILGKIVYWFVIPFGSIVSLYYLVKFIKRKLKRRTYRRRRRRAATRSGSTRRRTRKRTSTRAGKRKFSSMKAKMAWVRSQRKKKPKKRK